MTKKAGSPTKLTKEKQDEICAAIEIGATYFAAARYAGISYRTLRNWLEWGEAELNSIENGNLPNPDKKIYLQFFHAVETSISQLQVKDLSVIEQAASNDPQWAWRRLQYRFAEFRDISRTEITGKGGQEIILKVVYDDPGDGVNHPSA